VDAWINRKAGADPVTRIRVTVENDRTDSIVAVVWDSELGAAWCGDYEMRVEVEVLEP
jgi:hypothetical protein